MTPQKGPEDGCRSKIVEKCRKIFLTIFDVFCPARKVRCHNPGPFLGHFNQEPKKNPKAKKSHEQHQRIFCTIRGHYPIKQGFRGTSHRKVHPKVRRNLSFSVLIYATLACCKPHYTTSSHLGWASKNESKMFHTGQFSSVLSSPRRALDFVA